MSLEKIVQRAMENNPLKVKEEFESEIATRIQAALEEKYAKMMSDEELTEEELVESEDEEEDESEDEVEDEEDDEKEMDEKACVGEMKKLHASSCGKMEMFKTVREKYGCTRETFNKLYAQYCK